MCLRMLLPDSLTCFVLFLCSPYSRTPCKSCSPPLALLLHPSLPLAPLPSSLSFCPLKPFVSRSPSAYISPGPALPLLCFPLRCWQQHLTASVTPYSRSFFSTWFWDTTLSLFAFWLTASPLCGAPYPGASAALISVLGLPE